MPPKIIYTIVSGSGLPLTKVCLKGETNPRRIYKKIRETLVKNGIINHNTVLKWTIHNEEIMINHFIDLSELLQTINKCNAAINSKYILYKTIYDITIVVFKNAGHISSELEYLYNLKELCILDTITDKQFIGFSSLHNLEILSFRVSTNILTIPLEYKNLKKIHTLTLDGYGSQEPLIAAPLELGILQNIKSLGLACNHITVESLESITQLKKLEYLDLSSNSLIGLPDIFDRLIYLTELNLSCNSISEYPCVINQIQTLKILNISENILTVFPDIQLPNLRKLDLISNNIDNIESKNINIPKLEKLYLIDNELSSIPEFIYLLQNLSTLSLDNNHIDQADLDAYKSKYPNVIADF